MLLLQSWQGPSDQPKLSLCVESLLYSAASCSFTAYHMRFGSVQHYGDTAWSMGCL